MHSRALPAALHLTVLGRQPLSTVNLRADCERWCRDHLAPRPAAAQPSLLSHPSQPADITLTGPAAARDAR